MPKYETLRRIDQRKRRARSVGFSGLITVGGGSSPSAPVDISTVANAIYDIKKGRRYFSTETWLAVDLASSQSAVSIRLTGAISGAIGKTVILSERGVGEEQCQVVDWHGKQSDGTFLMTVVRSATPLSFHSYLCRVYVQSNYFRLYTDAVEPALLVYEEQHNFKGIYGSFQHTPTAFRSNFYSFESWEADDYGIATEQVRISDKLITKDAEIMGVANVRDNIKAVPLNENAGMIGGNTPMGPGFSVVDAQGYPYLYAVTLEPNTPKERDLVVIQKSNEDLMRYNSQKDGIGFKVLAVIDSGGEFHGTTYARDAINPALSGVMFSGHTDKNNSAFDVPNHPLELGGSTVGVGATFGIISDEQSIDEEHYLIAGPSSALPDGRNFTPIYLGPRVNYAQKQNSSVATNLLLSHDTETAAITAITTNTNYPVGSIISFSINLSEETGHDMTFAVRISVANNIQYEQTVILNNVEQVISGSYVVSSAIASGAVVRIRVFPSKSHTSATGYIRGANSPTRLAIAKLS